MKHKWELKGQIRVFIYLFFTIFFPLWFAFVSDEFYGIKMILTLIFLLIAVTYIIIDGIYFFIFEEKDQQEYRQYLLKELQRQKTQYINVDSLDENEKNCVSTILNEHNKNDNKDIIALMLKNNDEITEYFKISKGQARASFVFSVIFCVAGMIALIFGIYGIVALNDVSVSVISLISGSISEFISGTTFWLHNKSALQLNHYYDALHENEKFLSAVSIADKLSDEKREEILVEIIRKQISDTPPKVETENKKEQ